MVDGFALTLGVVAAIALERVAEVRLSHRNAEWAFARGAVESGRGHYGLMVAFHTLFLVACVVEPLLRPRHVAGASVAACLVALVCAQVLRWWTVGTLGRRWNARIIVLPDAEPVISGPYRWLRHPNYLAVIVEMVALPLLGGAWITAVCASLLNGLLLTARIRAEERALGARWLRAFAATPRFVPGGPRAAS